MKKINEIKILILKILVKRKKATINIFKEEFNRINLNMTYKTLYSNIRELSIMGLVNIVSKKPFLVSINREKEKSIVHLVIGWEECLKN